MGKLRQITKGQITGKRDMKQETRNRATETDNMRQGTAKIRQITRDKEQGQ